MKRQHERELEKVESWDFEKPEVREPVKASRVVVSVAFRHEDFVTVAESAKRSGKKMSEFIRDAVIEKAIGRGAGVLIYGSGSAGTLWSVGHMPTFTRVSGPSVEPDKKLGATTHG